MANVNQMDELSIYKLLNAEETAKEKKPSRAEEHRQWFKDWYKELGFEVQVPLPAVSNREFRKRKNSGQALFYRPATSEMDYKAFMRAVGQAEHWTVVHEDHKKIGWEDASESYWFWAEVAESCPRLGRSWNELNISIRLLSLEEDVIVWHAHKCLTGKVLDTNTFTWLRTRFGRSALFADGFCGGVNVNRWLDDALSIPHSNEGGRLAEVVKNAA